MVKSSMACAEVDLKDYASAARAPYEANSCLIVGAGPAGLAPLVAAASSHKLRALLDAGVTIVESGGSAGCGDIGNYAISSDSAAEAFLDAITQAKHPELTALRDHPVTKEIAGRIGQSVPLRTAACFLQLIGEQLCEMVRLSRRGRVLMLHRALYARQTSDGGWVTCVRNERLGTLVEIKSKSLILAAGANQPASRLHTEAVAGVPLLPAYAGKVMQSGHVLTAAGIKEVRQQLKHHKTPRVAVIGGSASAGAVARVLLDKKSGIPFADKGVTVMHRRPMRIFYASVADALQDGYTDFGPDDICPVSGRVYRLAGFRLESREMMIRALGVGGRERDPRLKLHQIVSEGATETLSLLNDAHLIIAAMGYRPRALPVFDVARKSISLRCATDELAPMVDHESRVIDDRGQQVTGLYGIGLAAGFVPHGKFGGEPSFRGQANSLWLWQHDVGEQIADAVLRRAAAKDISSPVLFRGVLTETLSGNDGGLG